MKCNNSSDTAYTPNADMDIKTKLPHTEVDDRRVFPTVFRMVLGWRIFYGICKVIFALALIKWVVLDPSNIFYQLMSQELLEDSNDFFVRFARPIIDHLTITTSTTTFIAVYLLFWGIVDDIILSINILRDKLWAFPVALALIALFVPYELYRVIHTHSLILAGMIVFDIVLFKIILTEYRKETHRRLVQKNRDR